MLLQAGAIRVKPILLTALAAMISALTILPDEAFQGLGVSLLFGVISSTFLTLLVIPAIYIVIREDGRPFSGEQPMQPAAPTPRVTRPLLEPVARRMG